MCSYIYINLCLKTAYIHASALLEENHNKYFNVFNCFFLLGPLPILMWCDLAIENVTKTISILIKQK